LSFPALPQNLDKNINSFHVPYSNDLADLNNVNKEFLQKNPPKKILQKNFSQKIPPKTNLQKKSSKKNHTKKILPKQPSKKIHPKEFLSKNSKKIPKILKISNSLHRT
jgi:hypothetical protein